MGQGNIFTPVCHSVHRGDGRSTWAGTPPWQVPPGQVHTPSAATLLTGTPPGQVHLPGAVHAGRYRQKAGGMHPTGIHSCSTYVYALLARSSFVTVCNVGAAR